MLSAKKSIEDAKEDLKEGKKIYNELLLAQTYEEKEEKYEMFYQWRKYICDCYDEEIFYNLCRMARGE